MTFSEMFPIYSSYLVAIFMTIFIITISAILIILLILAIRTFIQTFKEF